MSRTNGIVVRLTRKAIEPWEACLDRSTTLPKSDMTIKPQTHPAAVPRLLVSPPIRWLPTAVRKG
ncbi:MAG: hypothetical protein ACQESR_06240 [Planctomycetota bacterium]